MADNKISYSFNRKKKRRYDIRPGTDDSGRDYELQVAAYLSLKCLSVKVKQFWIAMNADGLEAFDDIILYKEDESSDKSLYLMQLKHRNDPQKHPYAVNKKDFSLQKYEQSFREIESMLNSTIADIKYENTKLLLQSTGVDCSDIKYVFFTNNYLKKTQHLWTVDTENIAPLLFMQTNEAPFYTIVHEKMKCNCKENCSKDFYSRFYICGKQKCAHQMREVLAEELHVLFVDLEESWNLIAADRFMDFLKKYCNFKVSDYEIREVLSAKVVKNKIAEIVLSLFLYKPKESDKLFPHLSNANYNTWLNITKLFQVILLSETNEFVNDIIAKNTDRIVISPCPKIGGAIVTALKFSKNLKIIIINCKEKLCLFEKIFAAENVSFFSRLEHVPKDTFSLLNDCTVYLQGRATKFKYIHLKHKVSELRCFTSDSVLYILGDNLRIGKQYNSLPSFYVVRSLPRITLSTDVFNLFHCIFIIIDTGSIFYKFLASFHNKDLSSIVRRVQHEHEVMNIMSYVESQTESIHVLKLHMINSEFALEWIHSKTENIRILKKYRNKSKDNTILKPVNEIITVLTQQIKSKTLVIANAGMGKSVFLNYLWSIYPTDTWIIYICLNDIDFFRVNSFSTFLEVYKANMDQYTLYIFEAMLQTKSVAVLVDGFDEIAPTYVTESSKIISDVIDAKLKIIVTSRIVTKSTLVDLLNVPNYTLEPFNRNDQISFLCQYYEKYFHDNNVKAGRGSIENFSHELLVRINMSVWDRSFSEIPLQCHMLAEAFQEHCVNFCESGRIRLPSNLSLLHLYELFVQKKLKIYWQEKVRIDSTTAAYRKLLEARTKEIERNHMAAALQVVFLGNIRVQPSEDFLSEVRDGHDKCGLITRVVNNRPIFLHRTFAEYFAALWLSKNYRQNPRLLEVLMKSKYTVIRDVLDRIFCKENALHTAVLNNDVHKVEFILESDDSDKDACSCGRTVFHLIASRGAAHALNKRCVIIREEHELYKPMMELVLEKGIWHSKKDNIMNWTPLEYAEKKYAVGVIDLFFKFKCISECCLFNMWKVEVILRVCAVYDYVHLAQTAIKYFDIQSNLMKVMKFKENYHSPRSNYILHIAASNNSTEMIVFFLKYIDVDIRNHLQQTPLHLACKSGHLETVQVLIANGANPFTEEDYGRIPLDIAVAWNHAHIEDYLASYEILKMGFNEEINKGITSKGDCALHLAVKGKNVKAIERLLEEGSLVNTKNQWFVTPLYIACEQGSLDITKLLIKNDADLYIQDRLGYILLDKAIQAKHAQLMQYLSSFEMLKIWFGNEVDKEFPNFGRTALHLASAAGNVECVRRLLLGGANIKATSTKWIKWTPLHFAVYEEHLQVVKTLVTFGADTNARAHWDERVYHTPLAFARLKKSQEDAIFKFLYPITKDKDDNDVQFYKKGRTVDAEFADEINHSVELLSEQVDEMLRTYTM